MPKTSTALLLGVMLTVLPIAVNAEASVNLCFENRDNSPYILSDSTGMLIELVNRASEQAGIAVHYHPLPWKRCLTMVEQGGIDGALALVWNQDRQARFAYPLNAAGKVDRQRRIWQGEYLIMLPARSPVQWDGKQFSHLEGGMASPLGYASSEKLRSLNAFAFDSPPDKGLLLVSKNRLPGYVVQKEIGFKNLQSLGIEKQVKVLPIPFMTEDWYLVFSSDLLLSQPQLTARLWAAVARERIRLQSGKSTP